MGVAAMGVGVLPTEESASFAIRYTAKLRDSSLFKLPGGLMEQINASIQRGPKADVRRRMIPPHRQSLA